MTRGTTWGADATSANERHLAAGLGVLWAYITGTPDIAWTPEQLADPRYEHASIYTINQGFGSKSAFEGDEFDLEAGAWTVPEVVQIIEARNGRHWSTRVYCSHTARFALMSSPVDLGSVFFRIADWSVSEEEATARLGGNVYAWQWASPSSNPRTILPGTDLTLAESDVDLNVISLRSTEWQG
jgi:hypothetical protein